MKKKVLIGIIILSAAIISLAIFSGNNSNTTISGNEILAVKDTATISQDTTNATSIVSKQSIILIEELNKHSLESDCWVSYKGKVYDITAFLPKHAGSAAAIIPYCGTANEFEKAFTAKHGTTKASLLMKVGIFIGDFEIVGNTQ